MPYLKRGRGDSKCCKNYRGISSLIISYKIFSSLLYKRLGNMVEIGFKPNKSTVDSIHVVKQICEKCYEFNIDLHNAFVDFKQLLKNSQHFMELEGSLPCSHVPVLSQMNSVHTIPSCFSKICYVETQYIPLINSHDHFPLLR
jgi:hypothetical protein